MSDAAKTAEAFLKISSVYKEENNDVKNAVLDSIGELMLLVCFSRRQIRDTRDSFDKSSEGQCSQENSNIPLCSRKQQGLKEMCCLTGLNTLTENNTYMSQRLTVSKIKPTNGICSKVSL